MWSDVSNFNFTGGLEAFEENLRKEEEAKQAKIEQEKQRRLEISTKTRNRLTKLLDRKRAEASSELERCELFLSRKTLENVAKLQAKQTSLDFAVKPFSVAKDDICMTL